jgi:hypothetical protein
MPTSKQNIESVVEWSVNRWDLESF